jgi:hypothetical protein
MLRDILPSLESHQTELYCSNYIFIFYYLFFLSGAFTSNFLAEWIAIKRPNLSHVIQFH